MREKLKLVLLIDDNEADNHFHKMVVESANVTEQVKTVESGFEALEYLSSSGKYSDQEKYPNPDLIFLDINMPGMNGWEFLDKYHELPAEQKGELVIIMLTTSLNPDDAHKAEEISDISGFRNKPLTKAALLQIIEEKFPQLI